MDIGQSAEFITTFNSGGVQVAYKHIINNTLIILLRTIPAKIHCLNFKFII